LLPRRERVPLLGRIVCSPREKGISFKVTGKKSGSTTEADQKCGKKLELIMIAPFFKETFF